MKTSTPIHKRGILHRFLKSLMNFLDTFKRNRAGVFGLIIVLIVTVLGIFAPIIAVNDPYKVGLAGTLLPPNEKYLFGTDDLGRDVFARVVYGTQTSLLIGFVVAMIAITIGMLTGAISGFYGGRIDNLMMRATEIFQVIPRFFLAVTIVAIFGASMINIILVIAILTWPISARLVRSEVLSLKEREFTEAAKVLGASDLRIIFSEILPNALSPLVVSASLEIASVILIEAALGYTGLSDPNVISLGKLMNQARSYIQYWWIPLFPGLILTLACLGLNLLGDGLNDALNPKRRR